MRPAWASIAREAGVSKGTLYVYFKSKEELFEAIVEEQCRQQAEQIFNLDSEADVETELTRVGDEFARFLCRPGGVSPLRTVIAIADRMPELGAKFYQSGPAHRHRQPEALFRRQGRGRHAGAARLRGGRRAIHRLLPVDDVQADAVQLRRPTGRHARSSTLSIWRCTHSSRHTGTADLPPRSADRCALGGSHLRHCDRRRERSILVGKADPSDWGVPLRFLAR